jgi:hypothetical protein
MLTVAAGVVDIMAVAAVEPVEADDPALALQAFERALDGDVLRVAVRDKDLYYSIIMRPTNLRAMPQRRQSIRALGKCIDPKQAKG